MIGLEHVSVRFGDKAVLEDFSFSVPQQGVTVLSGPSGCGKTTALRLLAGLLSPQSGRVYTPGIQSIAFLFQENRLLPGCTVAQQLRAVLPRRRRSEVAHWLALVGLSGEETTLPHQLSGGMGRRLALARTLALGGSLYLLDEPFAGVDPERQRSIMAELLRLEAPVVLVSHETHVLDMAHHIVRLDGPPLKLL